MITNTITQSLEANKLRLSLKTFDEYIFAFCLFLLIPPYFIWNKVSPLLLITICVFLTLKHSKITNRKHLKYFVLFIGLYTYIAVMNESNIFGYFVLFLIPTILINSDTFLNKVFTAFIQIYSITLIPSLIVFLTVHLFRLDLYYDIIEPLNVLKSYKYRVYPFLVQENTIGQILLPRFHGYYDEPGVIGTISGILLISTGFNLRNKIYIPIFIAGIFSLSFTFYTIIIVYGFLFLKTKYKIVIATLAVIIVALLSNNEIINSTFFSRFQLIDGKLAGDNRIADADNFNAWYKQFAESNDFYFGLGKEKSNLYNSGGSSYLDIIVSYGIVFFILYILALVIRAYSYLKLKKEILNYLFILLVILYQRPYITTFFYMFLIFASLPYLYNSLLLNRLKALELENSLK
ncbi:MAG: hypothetical protein ACOYO1_13065 [Bacteroidales bacterium]